MARNSRESSESSESSDRAAAVAAPAASDTAVSASEVVEVEERTWRTLLRQLRPAIVITMTLTIITGILYPVVTTGVAQALFPSQANGSLVYSNGKPVASKLIGQYWTQPQYLHGRPSVTVNLQGTPAPYEANNSAGSNLGPTNANLTKTVQQRIADLKKENPDVPAGTPIPVDLVTASASGLDPDVSVAGAYYQIPRIAKARGMSQDAVRAIIDQHITGRFLGIFGEPRVNVLDVNLALDGIQTNQ